MLAAKMYADDSAGLWFYNQPEGEGQQDWVTVEMDWGATQYNGGAECTNWQLLITYPIPGSTSFTPASFFTPYIKDPFIYRCPADPSSALAPHAGQRVRSYSASQAVGTVWSLTGLNTSSPNTWKDGPVTGQWLGGSDDDGQTYGKRYQKDSDMTRPSPAKLWVFSEEHPDTINDAGLAVQIAETGPGSPFIDMPANYHDSASSFSFADGHGEIHKWQGGLVGRAGFIEGGGTVWPNGTGASGADLKDLNWLQARTSNPVDPRIPFPQQ
jgi:hypothetical protein